MKKLISTIALAAITFGSLYAAPVQQRTDTTKKDTAKVHKKWKDTTNKIKRDTIKPR